MAVSTARSGPIRTGVADPRLPLLVQLAEGLDASEYCARCG
jgi:hypothetical protein